MNYRIEKDFLGEEKIPEHAYWGIHTYRAQNNFNISDYKVNPSLLMSLGMVKKACCLANTELGYLNGSIGEAIAFACDEILEGKLLDNFPVDGLQGGAGTSTNMNMNEVIANRAIELLGGKKGDYSIVHPLDHVNLHPSFSAFLHYKDACVSKHYIKNLSLPEINH